MKNIKISEGYKDIQVYLQDITLKIGKLFWDSYKMTWNSLQEIEYDPKNQKVIQACKDIVKNAALPTPKESINFRFRIDNISIVCLKQITRGRIGWWYVVESQMPEPITHRHIMPLNIYNNSKFNKKAKKLIELSIELYKELIKAGCPPQDARYLTLQSQGANLVTNTNYQALKGFFTMRTENALTDELNYVARLMKYRIRQKVNEAYHKQIIDDLEYELWEMLLDDLDCLGAKQKKCLIYDDVLGNFGRYPPGHDRVPHKDGKVKPRYDFTKSAWYLELKKLPEELLLPDEKEMIEKWK